jgi:hypothetical protein
LRRYERRRAKGFQKIIASTLADQGIDKNPANRARKVASRLANSVVGDTRKPGDLDTVTLMATDAEFSTDR